VGGQAAVVFAGLTYPGLFQFNVMISTNTPSGDNPILPPYNGTATAPVGLITIQGSAAQPTPVTFYVAPGGNDFWSGRLPVPNSTNTDHPFATFAHARAYLQSISKVKLNQVSVQFRAGTYYLAATETFTRLTQARQTPGLCTRVTRLSRAVISGGIRI
jgi:hypothetical protein